MYAYVWINKLTIIVIDFLLYFQVGTTVSTLASLAFPAALDEHYRLGARFARACYGFR